MGSACVDASLMAVQSCTRHAFSSTEQKEFSDVNTQCIHVMKKIAFFLLLFSFLQITFIEKTEKEVRKVIQQFVFFSVWGGRRRHKIIFTGEGEKTAQQDTFTRRKLGRWKGTNQGQSQVVSAPVKH